MNKIDTSTPLQDAIDKYLLTYKMSADHTTGKVYDENGAEQGVYDFLEHSEGDDDGRMHIAFHVALEPELTIIPTLVVHF